MPIVNSSAPAANFELPPLEALAFFRAKGLKPTFAWQDMLGDEHDLAFTVAKMMDLDLLSTVRGKLDRALLDGKTLTDFKRDLIPTLQAAGWWGKQDVLDPLTGQVTQAQLGSASRLETIFRTNLQSAYAVGRWQAIEDQAGTAPYLLYDAVDDHRTRPEHAALDGLVLKVDDPFWNTHAPSNGWNCRCGVIQLDDDQLKAYGLSGGQAPEVLTRKWQNPRTGDVRQVPTDLDPGWDHNPGKARYQQLKALAAEKAAAAAKVMADGRTAAKIAAAEAKIDAQVVAYKAKVAKLKADQPTLKSKLKAQVQKLAQGELDHHLDAKTPYFAQAITQLQGTKAGQAMSPAEQLAAAKDKALVIEQSAHLSGFKASSIKGNAVSAKQQAAFDALPDEAKASMLADIEVKSGVAEAKAELAQIAAGTAEKQAGLKKKLFVKWSKDGTLAKAENPKAALQAIEAEAAVLHAKAEKASTLSGYKKKILEGQVPTPKQKQVFDALASEEQAAFLVKLDVAKAAQAPKAELKPDVSPELSPAAQPASADVESPLPALEDLTQIGGQGGSNPGGLYQDINTGTRWYIKQPTNADHAKNEVLAAKLYEAAGIEVPEIHYSDADGKPRVFSKIVDGMAADAKGLKAGTVTNAREAFAVDAWLANWDVVGLGYDNMLVKQGRAIRIDTGGALVYRAQGAKKGSAFGNTVDEIDSLRDASLNPQAASVFKGMTDADLGNSVGLVAKLDDNTIRALIEAHGPGTKAERKALAAKLIARKQDLVKRYPPTAVVTAEHIAVAKATEHQAKDEATTLDSEIVMAIKGIAANAQKEGIRQKDIDRANELRAALASYYRQYDPLLDGASRDAIHVFYDGWLSSLDEAIKGGVGAKVSWGGGFYSPFSGALNIDPSRVKLPEPGKLKFAPAVAHDILQQSLGSSAANMTLKAGKSKPQFKEIKDNPGYLRSITAYTGHYYRAVNDDLRGGKPKPASLRYAELLNDALANSVPYQGKVSRGLHLSGAKLDTFIKFHKTALATGEPIQHDGFMSTSKGEKAAFGGNVKLDIISKSGVDVKPLSLHPGENEVLLQHGAQFRVKQVDQLDEKWVITMEEI